MWVGKDGKPSVRRVFAIYLIIDLRNNISHVIHTFQPGTSFADVAMLLGIEAGLIAALLTLTTYSNSLKLPSSSE